MIWTVNSAWRKVIHLFCHLFGNVHCYVSVVFYRCEFIKLTYKLPSAPSPYSPPPQKKTQQQQQQHTHKKHTKKQTTTKKHTHKRTISSKRTANDIYIDIQKNK